MSGAHLRANANTLATTADRPRPLGPSPLRKVHTDNLVTLDSQVVAATDPTIEIPLAILDVVQVVINGRKAACSWYAAYTARQVSEAVKHIEKSNGRHQYFVDVLQQVLDILKKEAKRRRPKRKKKFDMATAINELSNLYLHLEVEEPEKSCETHAHSRTHCDCLVRIWRSSIKTAHAHTDLSRRIRTAIHASWRTPRAASVCIQCSFLLPCCAWTCTISWMEI
ncbi:hypothetical protein DOTSEDRAFT_74188 [Dothistroma septosporum NZE10]|uniref:DUF6604 domain-containing protein n=1 Tax=Dothistroma septosporum (strain NZE10 / CBS 128990) TaxID=675120 RepID=N1PEK1_DOTSN|nr:hypothetical protein DOTSEDRAFT_74188 [Dothistroma septosporum NZE10]